MFESNTNQACDTEAQTLGAGLLITTTTTSPKYGRFWRKSLYVGIFITLKKTPDDQESPLPKEPPASSEILERTSSFHVIDIHSEQPFAENVAEIVKQRDLNGLRRLGGIDGVLALLRSNLEVINLLHI